jgi:hypothetical protein
MLKIKCLALLVTLVALTSCAAYTGVTVITVAATGQSPSEHLASRATGARCSIYDFLWQDKDYVCEYQDPAKTYNRSAF